MSTLTDTLLSWAKPTLEREPQHFGQRFKRRLALSLLNLMIGVAIPFVRRNRFQLVDIRRGHFEARVRLRSNVNHIGTMYAGAMFLLAEVPGGIIALYEFGSAYFPILKDLKMSYLLPAKSDLRIRIDMSEELLNRIVTDADRDGKADFCLTTHLIDRDGQTVAESIANYQLRRRSAQGRN